MKSIMYILLLNTLIFSLNTQYVNATTPVASLSTFTSSGITFSRHNLSGPYEDYYEIDSIEKLYMIRFYRSSGFIVTRDLDFNDNDSYISAGSGFIQGNFDGDSSTSGSIKDQLTSGRGWLPIGTSSLQSYNNINGNDKIISNLFINNPDSLNSNAGGFFYDLRGQSNNILKFENITFSGVSVTSSRQRLGVISGYSGYIDYYNVHITGELTSTYSGSCGGSDWAWAGGIAGITAGVVNVVDVGINLNISAQSCAVGGMFGQYRDGLISNSFFSGSIINSRSENGGFIGNLILSSESGPALIRNSFANVLISGGSRSGSIIGAIQVANTSMEISNVYSVGLLVGSTGSAGMIGGTKIPDFAQSVFENSFSATVTSGTSTRQYFSFSNSDFINAVVDNNYVFNDIDATNRVNYYSGVSETTSGNTFLRSWQESVLGSGSNSWYMLHASGDNLPYFPILLRSGIYEPLNNQPFITMNSIPSFNNSGLSILTNTLDASNFPLLTPTFTVNYETDGGSSVNQEVIANGNLIVSNPQTIKPGYTFGGWYTDASFTNLYNFNTPVTSNLTLYAKWTLTTFTIILDSLGGSVVGPVSGNEGDVISLPVPTLREYRFDGWLNSQGQLVQDPYTIKNVNETFTAKWTFVTFSPVTIIPLERTYYLVIDEPMDIEFGEELILPDFDAYEMYGRIKTDLSEYVTITGEIGPNPGEYPITYTLSYEDTLITEEVMVKVVDTVPPTLTVDMPSSVFYKNETTPVITATDNAPGEVTVTKVKELDVMRPGVQLVIYDAVDASGNLTRVIQEVSVVMPEVRYEAVMVNAQRLMFVMYEHLMDFTSMVLYMAQSIIEPPVTSNEWEVYEEREFIATGPGERVYLQMRDALGSIISRESIELFWQEVEEFTPRRIRGEVVYPEVEPSYYIPWPLVGGISFGTISLSGISFWFLKRRNNEKE